MDTIIIKNVRVSFPDLFEPKSVAGSDPKYAATLVFDEGDAQVDELHAVVGDLQKAELKGKRLSDRQICLREGERPEYDGCHILIAKNKAAPVVLDGDGRTRIVNARDSRIYSGCRVNAKISLHANTLAGQQAVYAKLHAIQFAGDDEPFAGGQLTEDQAMDGFDAVDGDDDFMAA